MIETRQKELAVLERDISKLERVLPPFPRITYEEAIGILQKKGNPARPGDDFGGDEETRITSYNVCYTKLLRDRTPERELFLHHHRNRLPV